MFSLWSWLWEFLPLGGLREFNSCVWKAGKKTWALWWGALTPSRALFFTPHPAQMATSSGHHTIYLDPGTHLGWYIGPLIVLDIAGITYKARRKPWLKSRHQKQRGNNLCTGKCCGMSYLVERGNQWQVPTSAKVNCFRALPTTKEREMEQEGRSQGEDFIRLGGCQFFYQKWPVLWQLSPSACPSSHSPSSTVKTT